MTPNPPEIPMTAEESQPEFASAISEAKQTSDALDEISAQLRRRFEGPADLLAVFATPHHAGAFGRIYERLNATFRPQVMLGTTGEGVVGVKKEVEHSAGLTALVGRMPGVGIEPLRYDPHEHSALVEEPQALAKLFDNNTCPRGIVLLADPFTTPIMTILPNFDKAYPTVPVVGGLASASAKPGGNRLLIDGKIYNNGAVGVGLFGPVHLQCTVSQGCRPVGKPWVITRSKRHVVQQLGGKTALDVVRQMVADLDPDEQYLVQSYGLQVGRVIDEYRHRFGRGDFLIRGINGVDHAAGCFGIADPSVRTGQTIQFHVRDQATAREDFSLLLEAQKLHGRASGALLFTCNGRGTNLFDRSDTDPSIVADSLGPVPLAGFFAAGEVGPIGDQNFVHGHTASLVVFRPENGSAS